MLYQMLAGVLPFRGDSMAELMYKIANDEAADIRIIRPELSEAIANIVALALSKRQETRYQTGDQFAADIRSVLLQSGGMTQAKAPSSAADKPVFESTAAFSAPLAQPNFEATIPGVASDRLNKNRSTDLDI
jgi:serine/threonine-protein kinase